jgi:hypothetical protein
MWTLMGWAVSLDPHRCCHRADPLVLLVPHLDDDIAGISSCQPTCANLSRRAGRRLHGSIQAVELSPLVIAHERLSILDIEIITGHGTLLLASPCSVLTFN